MLARAILWPDPCNRTQRLAGQAKAVTIATFKPDKYDRYLADVFLTTEGSAPDFLNNALLVAGHAVRKDEYSLTDWDGEVAKPR